MFGYFSTDDLLNDSYLRTRNFNAKPQAVKMAQHNDLGFKGEEIAKAFLENSGYEILDENWVHGKAEVDLIAYQNRQIIFVEVKTRTSVTFGMPEDAVSEGKQKQLEWAATEYIEIMNHQGEVRFDIISIVFDKQDNYTINHIEDAFWPS